MENEDYVAASEFCSVNNIEISFLYSLDEYGIIEFEKKDEMIYIPAGQLSELEKIIRLYYDMDINFEGIGPVIDLLKKNKTMQEEINELRNRLRFYEDIDLVTF